MARYNIKLDYAILEALADNCGQLASSLENIQKAVSGMEGAVQNCGGEAIKAITGKGDEIVKSMLKLDDGLELFSKHINKYCSDMKSIINSAGGGMLHINTVDVSWNLGQMINELFEFDDYARTVNPRNRISGTGSFAATSMDSEVIAQVQQVESRLDDIKEILIAAANDLLKYDEDFEGFKKIISEFENKDDEYRDILQEVYYEISDASFWNKTSTKVIIGITLIALAVVIVFVAPALAAVGGVVGACAAAIAGCTWLVAIATEVIAVGLFTAVFAGGIATFSGEDIEDAVGGGLFEGTVTSVITGGFGQIASSSKYLSYGAKALSKTPLKNNVVVKEGVEVVMEEGMGYAGAVLSSTFLKLYNGKEVNISKIGMDAAFDRGLSKVFKGVGKYVDDNINTSDIHLIRDGKLSLNDLKNAVRNGMNNKGVDAVKEVSSQVGHDVIDNYYTNTEEPLESNQEEVDINVDPSTVSEKVVKNELKGRVVDGLKNYVESEVEEATGVEIGDD